MLWLFRRLFTRPLFPRRRVAALHRPRPRFGSGFLVMDERVVPTYSASATLTLSAHTVPLGGSVVATSTVTTSDPMQGTMWAVGVNGAGYDHTIGGDGGSLGYTPSVTTDTKSARITFTAAGTYVVSGDWATAEDTGGGSPVGAAAHAEDTVVVVPLPLDLVVQVICPNPVLVDSSPPVSATPTGPTSPPFIGGRGNAPVVARQSGPRPVRYADGLVTLAATDLSSEGFGGWWGQDRTWSNSPSYSTGQSLGNGWVTSEQPRLLIDGATLVLVTSGTTAEYFDGQGTPDGHGNYPTYAPRRDGTAGIAYDSGDDEFVVADGNGGKFRFAGFGTGWQPAQWGALVAAAAPGGADTVVTAWDGDGRPTEVQRSVTAGGVTTTESYLTAYVASGADAGRVETVTLRRKVGAGSWSVVRSVSYEYYGTGDDNGTPGDLKRATVADGAAATIDQYYYRYYTDDTFDGATQIGYAGGLKYAVGPEAYARLKVAAGGDDADVDGAADSTVAGYADNYFEYDAQHRATTEVASGAGCSACSAGQGTYTYSYTPNPGGGMGGGMGGGGTNDWATKTVETLPGGTTNTVYTNVFGQVMLAARTDPVADQTGVTYYRYDEAGRVVLEADPSAVTGYDDAYPDLVQFVSGNAAYLRDGDGLVRTWTYASATTATGTTAGDVIGMVQSAALRRGETGTDVPQEAWTYYARTAGGATVYPVATDTVYRNDDGTGGRTTSYAYTWFSGTTQAETVTTTLPAVTTAQNGPNSSTCSTTVYDTLGRQTWAKDAAGFLAYTAYDDATGAVVKTITDVNTANTADFADLPSGWSTPTGGGLHLVTTYQADDQGRVTKATDPDGRVTYVRYNDAAHEVRTYPGWDATAHAPTGPITVAREDRAGGYTETLTMSATPALDGSNLPTGGEGISNIQSLSRSYRNAAGQTVYQDSYFDLTGVTYSTAANIGTQNTNFYRTEYAYGTTGQPNKTVSPAGTITRTEYDGQGRPISEWVGTDDTPTTGYWSVTNLTGTNMVKVREYEYDHGGVGDGNLTAVTEYPGLGADPRVTETWYDWRDRPVVVKSGVEGTEGTAVNRPITYTASDNLGEVVSTEAYDGDAVTVTTTGGVPDRPSSSLLRAKTTAAYDELGRVYRTSTYGVDPATGSVSSAALTTDTWYDPRGLVLKTAAPGRPVEKTAYDGAGRPTTVSESEATWDYDIWDAYNETGDVVVAQTEYAYDGAGHVTRATTRDRFHDFSLTTGPLGDPWTAPYARVSYTAAYYDALGRLTAAVDVGTNGGSAYTRPSSVPSRSDTVLVTSTAYDAAGRPEDVTDAAGHTTRTLYDLLGRPVAVIRNYTGATQTDTTDVTTTFAYGPAGLTSQTAALTGGGGQTTGYVYGTTLTASGVASNDVQAVTQWPDPSTGAASSGQQDVVTVNALGQVVTRTDRTGTVHTYTYDVLGRVTADAVTTLGSGVDGAVRRVETSYTGQGNVYQVTSYDAASGGGVVNQVRRGYNGLGQLTAEWQEHAGAVGSGTPPVQYAYSEMAGGANHSRLTSVTYPSGYVLTYSYGYSGGTDDAISRLKAVSDAGGDLEELDYLGVGTVVWRGHPAIGLDWTLVANPGDPAGDGGDEYQGLDRFGRVTDVWWRDTATNGSAVRVQYGYDRAGNRTFRDDWLSAGEVYTYDGLDQLASFQRGTLNGSRTGISGTVARSQSWDADALGNFDSVTTNGTAQTRTANKQNEIGSISGATTPTYDAAGRMTGDETGRQFVYDAWGRLVKVKNSSGTLLETFGYDGQGRRITVTPSGGSTTDLYYSAQWQVLEERVGGTATARYVWSPVYVDAPILRDRDTDANGTLDERLYALQDANFNVTALVNTSGTVVERYAYDPYGSVTVLDGSYGARGSSSYAWTVGWQGLRYDATAGLYEADRRWESPTLGRWITTDPLMFQAGDNNFYRAMANNPVKYTDPSGLLLPALLLYGGVVILGTHAGIELGLPEFIGRQFPETLAGRTTDGYARWVYRVEANRNPFAKCGNTQVDKVAGDLGGLAGSRILKDRRAFGAAYYDIYIFRMRFNTKVPRTTSVLLEKTSIPGARNITRAGNVLIIAEGAWITYVMLDAIDGDDPDCGCKSKVSRGPTPPSPSGGGYFDYNTMEYIPYDTTPAPPTNPGGDFDINNF